MDILPTFPTNIKTKQEYETLVKKLVRKIGILEDKYGLNSNRTLIEDRLFNYILKNQNEIYYNTLQEYTTRFSNIDFKFMINELSNGNIYYLVCGNNVFSDILTGDYDFHETLDNYFVKVILNYKIKDDEAFLISSNDVLCENIINMLGFKRTHK